MCAVHGCDKPLFTPLLSGRQQGVCIRHFYARKSGRVGVNWQRDIHNFHRKGYCEMCFKTAYEFGLEILVLQNMNPDIISKRDIIKLGMTILQGDHINGRAISKAHHPENIQTLCSNCHRVKTIATGDHIPVKHRK